MIDRPNIIIIVIDTLRKDTINFETLISEPSSPFAEFDYFTNCISPAPWTVPSHASIFTGMYPVEHGLHEGKGIFLGVGDLIGLKFKSATLFHSLKKKGYTNIGISHNPYIRPSTPFEDGFSELRYASSYPEFLVNLNLTPDILSDSEGLSFDHKQILFKYFRELRFHDLKKGYAAHRRKIQIEKLYEYPNEKGATKVLEDLVNLSILKPFSLFLNLMEMHSPYPTDYSIYDAYKELISSERMNPLKVKRIRTEYSEQGRRILKFLTELLNNLKSMKAWDDTLIIITSDHGHTFWEQSYGDHGTFLFDELVRVPLLVKYPFNSRQRGIHNELCSLIDLFDFINMQSETTDSTLGIRKSVFSESFHIVHSRNSILSGITGLKRQKLNENLSRIDFRKIACFSGETKITLNGENGNIVEYLKKGVPAEVQRMEIIDSGILDAIEIFDSSICLPFR